MLQNFFRALFVLTMCCSATIQTALFSQNLIPNPGFEVFKKCPKALQDLTGLAEWETASVNSPSHFHTCAAQANHPLKNAFGAQQPHSGDGMAGAVFFDKNYRREYLQIELAQPLEKDKIYEASMWVCLAANSAFAADGLGMFFSRVAANPAERLFTAAPHVYSSAQQLIAEKGGWTKISGNFRAKGGEQYVVIGNFYANNQTGTVERKGKSIASAYYFIDDAALVAAAVPASENLLLNGDFEEISDCPTDRDQLPHARHWNESRFWEKHPGTADLFHTCHRGRAGVPKNDLGEQTAQSGAAYAGINLFSKQIAGSEWEAREYLQGALREPLQAGRRYCLRFFTSLAESSQFACDAIGVYFSKNSFDFSTVVEGKTLQCQPQIHFINEVISEKNEWVCRQAEFIATGGEQFVTVGNFQEDSLLVVLPVAGDKNVSYYYFDNFSLVPAPDSSLACRCATEQKTIAATLPVNYFDAGVVLKEGETFILKNIYFDFDKAELLPASHAELEKLAALLRQYPDMEIEIRGHTDNKGTFAYNAALSENRAKAVVRYLMEQNIAGSRLAFQGFSFSQPIADNASDEGRALNRRVEFFVKKF